jgi:thiamine-monophosphate kinase
MVKRLDPDDVPEWLATLWPYGSSDPFVIAGVNDDDCAVLQWDAPVLVVTTDYLNASPIAVQLGIATPNDLGRLVVASSVSDLCGSGAQPRAMLLGAMMEQDTTEEDFRLLMTGVKEAAASWGVKIIGGDTKLGTSRAILSVGIGSAPSVDNLFLKGGSKSGDLLWCSGPLGSCNAAAVGLRRTDLNDGWRDWAKAAILIPKIPLEKSRQLSSRCLGSGGTDISDGLGADLHKLCRASGIGAVVNAASIPIDPNVAELASKLNVEPWKFAFGCGGDFQFLVSTKRSARHEVEQLGFHLIGELTDQPHCRLQIGSRNVPLPSGGHRDARRKPFADEILDLIQDVSKPRD